jgi:hypothetical protein
VSAGTYTSGTSGSGGGGGSSGGVGGSSGGGDDGELSIHGLHRERRRGRKSSSGVWWVGVIGADCHRHEVPATCRHYAKIVHHFDD